MVSPSDVENGPREEIASKQKVEAGFN